MPAQSRLYGGRPMRKPSALLSVIGLLAAAGCATQTQLLDSKQGTAVQTAMSRARFDMNCQEVTSTVLSREVTQPGVQGPLVSGIQRAEFTIGVEGCGKRQTYTVLCPEGGEGCFAAEPGGFLRKQ